MTTMEICVEVSQKVKNRSAIWPGYITPECLHVRVHCYFLHSRQELQKPICQLTDETGNCSAHFKPTTGEEKTGGGSL